MRRTKQLITGVGLALTIAAGASGAGAVQSPQGVVVSADPVNTTPHILDGTVLGIAPVGAKVVVGGDFTQVRNQGGSTVLGRTHLFSYDAATGKLDLNFKPQLNGIVNSVAADPSGTAVFVGGMFSTVDGLAQAKLVKLDLATGQVVAQFRAGVTGYVNDLKVSNGRLFVGGQFTRVRGIARTNVASVDPVTGAVDADLNLAVTNPSVGSSAVVKLDVTPDGSRLALLGTFSHVAGVERPRMAVIDRTTSPDSLSAWASPRFAATCPSRVASTSWLRDVDFDPTGRYFVVVTTGAWGSNGNRLCDSASRWEMVDQPNQQPTWVNETGGDTLLSVAVTDVAVYVGGHQRWLNNEQITRGDVAGPTALTRSGIGALDTATGRALTWNPGRTRGLGVRDLVATPTGLFVGSDTDSLGGELHARIGMFAVAGGSAPVIDRTKG